MEYIKIIILFVCCFISIGCFSRRESKYIDTVEKKVAFESCDFKEINSKFDKNKWKGDSLGNLDYRIKYFNQDRCLLRLKTGMSKECIIEYLGEPYKVHEDDLEYLIQKDEMSIMLYFDDNYYKRSNLVFWSNE